MPEHRPIRYWTSSEVHRWSLEWGQTGIVTPDLHRRRSLENTEEIPDHCARLYAEDGRRGDKRRIGLVGSVLGKHAVGCLRALHVLLPSQDPVMQALLASPATLLPVCA